MDEKLKRYQEQHDKLTESEADLQAKLKTLQESKDSEITKMQEEHKNTLETQKTKAREQLLKLKRICQQKTAAAQKKCADLKKKLQKQSESEKETQRSSVENETRLGFFKGSILKKRNKK
eukprot:UN25487